MSMGYRMVERVKDEREALVEYDRKWHRTVGDNPCFAACMTRSFSAFALCVLVS